MISDDINEDLWVVVKFVNNSDQFYKCLKVCYMESFL